MRRITCLSECVLVLFCMSLWVPVAKLSAAQGAAQSQKQQGKWFYCYNTVPMPPSSMAKQFVTHVFQSDGDLNSISLAWDIYIGTKYAPVNQKDLLNLNTFHSPHCKTGNQINLQQMYDRDVKGGVTAVDWKYASRQDPQHVQVPKPVASAARSDPAQLQKQPEGGWWWYCQAGPYMTGVFFYPADITTRADVDAAIQTAWSNHVTREYPNQNLGTGCTLGGTDQASTQRIHDHMRASQKVVDVDWKYVPGRDVPPQPRGTKVYYCSAYFGPNGGENLAFSDSFEPLAQTDINRVRDDFVKFVREKYSAKDANGGCSAAPKAGEAGNMRGHKKIIETGWKPALVKSKPHYCFGYNGGNLYFSDIFEAPEGTDLGRVKDDFVGFLLEKYGLSGRWGWEAPVVCSQGDDKTKASNVRAGYKIIETGWKPKTLQQGRRGP